MQELLERLDCRQSREQAALLVRRQRLAVLARLDHLAQPEALLVTADVLDLVGDRAAVDVQQGGVSFRECLSGDVNP